MMQARAAIGWALGLVLAMELVVLYRLLGPAPKDAQAPLEEFSAARAVAVLQRILGDESPHPSGSVENGRVRDRLLTELRGLGLDVEVQQSAPLTEKRFVLCNVLARLPNTSRTGQPLVLATHYDSVATGPGAADAGSCVAVLLETARALQQAGLYRRPVYLLITDGEELGCRGAAVFVQEHALARERPFVLNFDARGSSGPSLMYETHPGNRAAIGWMARSLPRPCFTASSYVTVHRLLPNDSDFSIYSREGWPGLNFAFIDDAHHYHTAHDTLANLDHRSVQHHGEIALGLTRRIAGSDGIDLRPSAEDAVFFDVLGTWLVHFPQSWAWPLSVLAFVVLALRWAVHPGWRAGIRPVCLTLLAQFGAIALCALLGWALARGLTACGLLPKPYVPHGRWIAALYWPLSLAILGLMVRLVCRRVSREDVWIAYWLGSSIAGVVIAWWMPGFSYLWLVPALAAALLAVVPLDLGARLLLSVGIAGAVLLPAGNVLPMVFGPRAGAVLCPAWVLVWSSLLPCFVAGPRPR